MNRFVYSYNECLDDSNNQLLVISAPHPKLVADFYAKTPEVEELAIESLLETSVSPKADSAGRVAVGGRSDLQVKPGQEWFWSEAWQSAEQQAEADLKAGRFETFDTMEEFLAGLR